MQPSQPACSGVWAGVLWPKTAGDRVLAPVFALLLGVSVALPFSVVARAAPPTEAQPIMTIDEVRVGMRGYGKTVYHGDTIEPFPVEVMSIVPDSTPGRAVVWVSCYDERMQRYGPVQGMSGSPIYLWDEGEEQKLGVGGRLIGAFAFGYSSTNECMAGIQPIEYMRQTGDRAALPDEDEASASARRFAKPGTAVAVLRGFRDAASAQPTGAWDTWTMDAAIEAVSRTPWGRSLRASDPASETTRQPELAADDTAARPLMLPINVGSAETAAALRPMMAPIGLLPHAGGGIAAGEWAGGAAVNGMATSPLGGTLPSNVSVDRVELEPGSVLSIPLAFGDFVPAASGTVTDVLPDGTVLGLGHAMDGVGDTALPMATGYTHFVVSRLNISFKRSGAIALRGSIVQDEMSAVAGVPGDAYTTSPVTVAVLLPEQPRREYSYRVVNHPGYTPSIAVLMPIVSLTAVQTTPDRNTMRVTGKMTFSNGEAIEVDQLYPFGNNARIAWEFGPVMSSLLNNEFEPVELTDMQMDIDVVEDVKLSFVQSVSASPPVAKPGDAVELRVVTLNYGGETETHTIAVDLPTDLPPGEYPLLVGDVNGYLNRSLMMNPRYTVIDDADELFDVFREMVGTPRNALYATLMRPDAAMQGVSVGNLDLPKLPSHQAALLRSNATTLTGPGQLAVDRALPTEDVMSGEAAVMIRVVEP